ncbi:MAG: acyl-CoA thioester hydrolase [Parasphingorhabdus sp.]|jgi:acyl-CoA thioester hydrolase
MSNSTKNKELLKGVIHPWYCDAFGHMNVRWYAHFFDDAAFHIWPAYWGSHQKMQSEFGIHTVTGRVTTEFQKEMLGGDLILVDCEILRIGGKTATFMERMLHIDTLEVHATYEITEVFFDPQTRQSANMPEPIRDALQQHSSQAA